MSETAELRRVLDYIHFALTALFESATKPGSAERSVGDSVCRRLRADINSMAAQPGKEEPPHA